MRTIYTILITAVLAFLLGLAVFWGVSNSGRQTTHEEATVLLEQKAPVLHAGIRA